MPFPDEPFARRVHVVAYPPEWAAEGAELVLRLRQLVPDATAVDHIGSTSVPGMPAKDCLDVMIRVESLDTADLDTLAEADVGRGRKNGIGRSNWQIARIASGYSLRLPVADR